MKKWEYAFGSNSMYESLQEFMTRMGNEGWEAFAVDDSVVYFKREKV